MDRGAPRAEAAAPDAASSEDSLAAQREHGREELQKQIEEHRKRAEERQKRAEELRKEMAAQQENVEELRKQLAELRAERAPPDCYALYPLQSETIREDGNSALRDVGKVAVQLAGLAGIPLMLALAHDDFVAYSAPRVPLLGALRHLGGRPRTAAQLQAWLATPAAWAMIAVTLCFAAAAHAALRKLRPRHDEVIRVARVIVKAAAFYAAVWAVAGKQVVAVAVLRQAFILSPVTAQYLGLRLRRSLILVTFMSGACGLYRDFDPSASRRLQLARAEVC